MIYQDIILISGYIIGVIAMILYNPAMYGCIETHWSKKFILGLIIAIVSVAGFMK